MLSLLVGWGVGVGRVSDTDGHVLYFNLLTFFLFYFIASPVIPHLSGVHCHCALFNFLVI